MSKSPSSLTNLEIGESIHSAHVLFLVITSRIGFLLFLLLASFFIPDHHSMDRYYFPLWKETGNVHRDQKQLQSQTGEQEPMPTTR